MEEKGEINEREMKTDPEIGYQVTGPLQVYITKNVKSQIVLVGLPSNVVCSDPERKMLHPGF